MVEHSNSPKEAKCVPFRQVDFCETYDIQAALANSSFSCTKCLDTHFLFTAHECRLRTKTVAFCKSYLKNADKCEVCQDGHFLSSSKLFCQSFPGGIVGCIAYSAENECSKCHSSYYFTEKTCKLVTKEITYCEEYSDQSICSKCQQDFLLLDNVCVATQAKNCATYTSQTECGTCLTGHGFKQEGNLYNCVLKNVPDCVSSEDIEPYKCLECVSHFYSLEGVCSSVEVIINDCEVYETKDTCKKCYSGTVLSLDKKSCISDSYALARIDSHCSENKFVNSPICDTCQPGYYFENDSCIACQENGFHNGCF